MSNPSPAYVKDVALTFRSGSYVEGELTFGTGKHADLTATLAAILLHREARLVALDKDAAHGGFHEPLTKKQSSSKS